MGDRATPRWLATAMLSQVGVGGPRPDPIGRAGAPWRSRPLGRQTGYPRRMAEDATANLQDEALEFLSPEEKEQLQKHHYVKSGDGLIWIEPDGAIRKEKISNLYYIRTARGVFRISRISNEVVEV